MSSCQFKLSSIAFAITLATASLPSLAQWGDLPYTGPIEADEGKDIWIIDGGKLYGDSSTLMEIKDNVQIRDASIETAQSLSVNGTTTLLYQTSKIINIGNVTTTGLVSYGEIDVGSLEITEKAELRNGSKTTVNTINAKGISVGGSGVLTVKDKITTNTLDTYGTSKTEVSSLQVTEKVQLNDTSSLTLNGSSESSVGELNVLSGAKLTGAGASLTVKGLMSSSGTVEVDSLTTHGWTEFSDGATVKANVFESQDRLEVNEATFNVENLKISGSYAQFREGTGEIDLKNVELSDSAYLQAYDGLDITEKLTVKGNNKLSLWADQAEGESENLTMTVSNVEVEEGKTLQLLNASGSTDSSMDLGSVLLQNGALLENVREERENYVNEAYKNLSIGSLTSNAAMLSNHSGGKIHIGELSGESLTVLVGDTTANQVSIGKNTNAGLTITSSDSAYGNTMTSADQGVADLAATIDLNTNGAEGAEGMKVVIGANDMTGRIEAVYDAKGNKISQTEDVNETNRTLTAVANLPVVAWRAELNDLYKRMGDLRATPYKSGAWVRYNGGKLKWSDGDLENDFHMIQVGIDTMLTENNIRFGTAFSYTKGDADFDGGSADLDTYSLALYGTWLGDKGQYVDVIGRMASIKNDANARSLTGQGKAYDGKMDNTGLSLSAEAGWRFALPYNLFIEPQVEATYSYIDSDSFRYGDRKYELQSTDSFIARAGFMAGIQCPDNKGNVYVRASVVRDFLGETDVKVSNAHMSRTVSNDFGGTWGEFGIGANVSVSDNTYVYADVEHTTGGEIEEPWRVNFGVRYNF